VPSLQVTAALPDADAAGAAAPADPALALLADADLSTPPCLLHAPRPPCAAVVPSLHATGFALLSCAVETAGASIIAATHIAPHITALSFATFMCSSPQGNRPFQGRQEYRNPRGGGIGRQRSCGPGAVGNAPGKPDGVGSDPMTVRNAWLLSLLAFASAVPHAARAAWMERTEAIMGTRVYVQLWADDPVKGNAAIEAVMAEMRRIDALMSHYKPDSQLSQINAHANSEPVQVDKELFDLIKLSTHYSQITEGAFDITYASVGYLYDYRRHLHPTQEQIQKALPAVNWRNMLLDEERHSVRFEHPGMRIDLGGIGKGYAVDRGVGILKARGIQHAVVTAGGDSRIIGDHMGRPWLVAIRHPDDPKKVVTRIPLSDSAMSTSGDYERYFDENGVRYHHIIDPRTGHSASKVRSATILAPTATQTDGMSKTAFVLGPEKALEIINRMPEYDAVFVCPDGRVLYSNGLRPPVPRAAGAPPAAPTATSPRGPP
jgi:FAD:protein FMN transferase